jgi:uncharacterized membrane protein YfcA
MASSLVIFQIRKQKRSLSRTPIMQVALRQRHASVGRYQQWSQMRLRQRVSWRQCSGSGGAATRGVVPPLSVSFLTGCVSGTATALTGAGGGTVIIPALAQFTSLRTHTILGTSLLATCLPAVAGSTNYISQGVANVPIATLLAVTAIVTSGAGVHATRYFSSAVMRKLFGGAMLLSAPFYIFNSPRARSDVASEGAGVGGSVADRVRSQCLERWRSRTSSAAAVDGAAGGERASPTALALCYLRNEAHILAAGCACGFMSGFIGTGSGIMITGYLTLTKVRVRAMATVVPGTAALLAFSRLPPLARLEAGSLRTLLCKLAGLFISQPHGHASSAPSLHHLCTVPATRPPH